MNLPYLVNFDPVALQLGPLAIRWYGLSYLAGFLAYWLLGRYRASKPWTPLNQDQVADLLFYAMLGVILGGRLGYVLFYQPQMIWQSPLDIVKIWEGGMSFHGGLLGVVLAVAWYARKLGRRFLELADFIAPMAPLGLMFGRIANFVNGELWGRVSDSPWAMIFPNAVPPSAWMPGTLQQAYEAGALNEYARHPSQLYEAGLEGALLFILVWWYSSRPRPLGAVTGLFLAGYGVGRFIVEFFREPDEHLNYLAFDWLTMGMVLSLPMILIGVWLMLSSRSRGVHAVPHDKSGEKTGAADA